MPNPDPTDDEIELTREVLALKSYAETEGLIDALGDAQWAAQLADNNLWTAQRSKFFELHDKVEIKPENALERIRNRSRLRFGLPAISGGGSDSAAEAQNAGGLVSSLQWF